MVQPISFTIGGVIGLAIGFGSGWFTRAYVHQGASFTGNISYNHTTRKINFKWHLAVKEKPKEQIQVQDFIDKISECQKQSLRQNLNKFLLNQKKIQMVQQNFATCIENKSQIGKGSALVKIDSL